MSDASNHAVHRRRVLIGAYACDPEEGSEPGVGWHWSLQIARFADAHVITRSNNRSSIERATSQGKGPWPVFHYLDLPKPLQRAKKKTGTGGLLAYYYLWQLAAGRLARRLHAEQPFDLVHHVTFANDWLPSGLALVPNTPLVWGPIGGSTHRAPSAVEDSWSLSQQRYERRRWRMQRAIIRFDPFLALTIRRAAIALPYTREAAAAQHLPASSRVVTHIGMDDHGAVEGLPPTEGPLRIVTGGRLVHWKGHDLVMRGLAQVLQSQPGAAHLVVTGDGPMRSDLQDLARRLGIEHAVEFLGRLPTQGDVMRLIADSHVFALPTWRDGPPVAILEAMSVGTAPLYIGIGAADELVPHGAGLRIDPSPFAEVSERIGDALRWAIEHREDLVEMGARGFDHVRLVHDWETIGGQIAEIHELVCGAEPSA